MLEREAIAFLDGIPTVSGAERRRWLEVQKYNHISFKIANKLLCDPKKWPEAELCNAFADAEQPTLAKMLN